MYGLVHNPVITLDLQKKDEKKTHRVATVDFLLF